MAKQPRINAKLDFEWNAPYSVLIKNLGFGKEFNLQAAKIFYKWYRPYIPYKTGRLTTWVHFNSTKDHGTITHYAYSVSKSTGEKRKYSNYQYKLSKGSADGWDPEVNRTRTVHPLATSHWDKWAWSVHRKEITAEIIEERKKHRKLTKGKTE